MPYPQQNSLFHHGGRPLLLPSAGFQVSYGALPSACPAGLIRSADDPDEDAVLNEVRWLQGSVGATAHWDGPGVAFPSDGPACAVCVGCACIGAAGVYRGGGDKLSDQLLFREAR